MKKVFLLSLSILLLAISCKKDDQETFELRYDGAANSAPLLQEDVYEAAARFPSTLTTPYSGMQLKEVEFFFLEKPNTCKVIIYGEGNASSPGDVLYNSGEIIGSTSSDTWNTHTLPNPILLTGEDIWISIEVSHIQSLRSVGCDEGPAKTNGDWIYSATIGQWQTLRDFTSGDVDINWNIRGVVEE